MTTSNDNTGKITRQIGRTTVVVTESRRKEDWPACGGCSHKRFRVGTRTGDIMVEIDFDAIMKGMGEKALKNKSGKAQEISGAVTVYAVNVVEVAEEAVACY